MAVYKIFPEKDTTIYSAYPTTNAGLDQILELQNKFYSFNSNPQVSRILIKFPSDEVNSIIDLAGGADFYEAYLRLFVANTESLPDNYSIRVFPVSQSWDVGTGKFLFEPPYTDGCSWIQRDDENNWLTSSFAADSTASFLPNSPGGGVWRSTYEDSQSFSINSSKDINIHLTEIVENFHNGNLPHDGILLKMENAYEFNSSSSFSLKFFSKDTHTIYLPQLEIIWDDSEYNTGSLNVKTNENILITLGNNIGEYSKDTVFRFRVNARDIYPARQFTTSSVYLINKALPSSSFWALQDLNTGEFIVDFDENYTKVSCDSTGNYFDIYTNGLQPERYYKVLIKSSFSDGTTMVYDNKNIFKILK